MIRRGITGFGQANLNDLDLKILQFKKKVLSDEKYTLLEIIEQQVSNNYLQVCLNKINENKKIKILINCQFGYSCCVDFDSKWMNLNFIDLEPDLRKRINSVFPYLSPCLLYTSPSPRDS